MKKLFLFALLLVATVSFASEADWGRTGHRAIGQVAGEYLSKKAKTEITELLDGQSLAFVSTYADDIKSDSKYREYGAWHYVNLPDGETKYSEEEASRGRPCHGDQKVRFCAKRF